MKQPDIYCPDRKALFHWAVEQALNPGIHVALVVPSAGIGFAIEELDFLCEESKLSVVIDVLSVQFYFEHGGRISLFTSSQQSRWTKHLFTDAAVHGSALLSRKEVDDALLSIRSRLAKPKCYGAPLVAYAD